MSTLLTINIKNNLPVTEGIYIFQQPAVYIGGQTVYSNSIFSGLLGSYQSTGGILTFQSNIQFYAGVQEANSLPVPGQSSGFASASRPIELTLASGQASNNSTYMSLNPLGLSTPTFTPGVQQGAFRITTPTFAPPPLYNAGSAVNVNGGVVLSNFVQAYGNQNIDAQPVLIFYVQTGTYQAGTVVNYTTSSVAAAMCNFTGGYTTANVTLNPDGSWSTQLS